MNKEYIMYAGKLDNGVLCDFYNHPEVIKVICGHEITFKVKLTIDDEGTFWGWYDVEEDDIMFIHYHKDLVDMCFPYGAKAETDRGRGKIVRLKAEILGEWRKK